MHARRRVGLSRFPWPPSPKSSCPGSAPKLPAVAGHFRLRGPSDEGQNTAETITLAPEEKAGTTSIGVLVAALGVQTLRLAWLQAAVAGDKAAQAEAIRKLLEKAETLSNELVIQQAKSMAVTAEKEVVYVDKVHRIPVAPGEDEAARSERMRAGTSGVRSILCSGPRRPGLVQVSCSTTARRPSWCPTRRTRRRRRSKSSG